ncbi:MAG: DUF4054 domain-containing protein [Planctomycetota bacterium]|jgi:hypothetical protein|nr:DUF4054 domain-containing protein [Planctomycetota bacterium]|tara:strand:+ start:12 stop:341 length:330 start_codon:yes stop_codon:yes gene_type:complete
MAVSVEQIRQTFPTFRKTDQETITAKLVLARLSVSAGVWGGKTDAGVLFLTAHYLMLDPQGQNAKLKPENLAKTVYGETYIQIRNQVTFGLRLAGLPPAGAFTDPANGV